MKFIGRQKALDELKKLKNKHSASLVVIKGRRRIGKSSLAEEFSHDFPKTYSFTGLPLDDNVTVEHQYNEFIRQMRKQQVPSSGNHEWGDLFFDLAQYAAKGSVLVILDEITWMGSLDPTFLGKLKIAWDEYFKKNPKLILIISGSNSAWIEANILSKTGFFGRVSYRLTLDELSLEHCAEFWGKSRDKLSSYELLKILSVTGGIPRYLEEIHPEQTAEKNIYNLCYQSQGILFNEFYDIFSDLFQKRDAHFKEIIYAVANNHKTVVDIAKALDRSKGGDLSESLEQLCQDGFISRDFSWNLRSGKTSKISQYRIKDNYLKFYLKYILPHRHKIEIGSMDNLPLGWESILGLQFENLVLNNRRKLLDLLAVPLQDVVISNPYIQTATKRDKKCQIDFMIQTQFNTLYVCEIKFHKTELGTSVIAEMKEKLAVLKVPKGFSIRPVLIHVNGVNDNVIAEQFFSNVIDFGDFFKG